MSDTGLLRNARFGVDICIIEIWGNLFEDNKSGARRCSHALIHPHRKSFQWLFTAQSRPKAQFYSNPSTTLYAPRTRANRFIINELFLAIKHPQEFSCHRTFLLLTWWWWWLVWCVLCVWAASVCFCLECDWWCCDECWWWCGWLSRLIWWWEAFPEPWPTWMLCGRVELWGAECPWWPGWWPLCDSIRLQSKKGKVIARDSKANVNIISL